MIASHGLIPTSLGHVGVFMFLFLLFDSALFLCLGLHCPHACSSLHASPTTS